MTKTTKKTKMNFATMPVCWDGWPMRACPVTADDCRRIESIRPHLPPSLHLSDEAFFCAASDYVQTRRAARRATYVKALVHVDL